MPWKCRAERSLPLPHPPPWSYSSRIVGHSSKPGESEEAWKPRFFLGDRGSNTFSRCKEDVLSSYFSELKVRTMVKNKTQNKKPPTVTQWNLWTWETH